MGWPKGKPRKGHVNKDGTAHATWGQVVKRYGSPKAAGEAFQRARIRKMLAEDKPKRRGRPRKDGGEPDKKWNTKLTNKGLEKCPRCDFPEAYGGFCNECGWTAPMKYGRIT